MVLNKIVTVTKEVSVVKDTTTAAYSFSLSKLSANMEVMVEAGIADIIIIVLITIDEPTVSKKTKYIIIGIIINLTVMP